MLVESQPGKETGRQIGGFVVSKAPARPTNISIYEWYLPAGGLQAAEGLQAVKLLEPCCDTKLRDKMGGRWWEVLQATCSANSHLSIRIVIGQL